ncbi:uncharacterized protein (DUF1800 family) [Granulicella aggregans]|uniref:Uncharacterized protein (DUF1800 family) n=1 Tax=Granulicella aggregans TaxID=474949 RepID=A0A7W7ZCW0_9BACT|nr:DUF1800 domain-containing protein [Granulicella aggregans]MBB5057555.1 uncharacterized protein (DUF1800 family) [Granulicella aggregans]
MRRCGLKSLVWAFIFSVALNVQSGSAAFGQDDPLPATPGARTFAGKPKVPSPPKGSALVPLNEHDRALQLLDRFTFGPRPGELERVLAMGGDKWLEQQLKAESIPDGETDKRLGDFPTLNMKPEQALLLFPDRGAISAVADGRTPYPTDPLLASMYEVEIYKFNQQKVSKTPDAKGNFPPEPGDAEKAAQKAADQATAARIAGELFALPKNQRMAELIKMSVPERIAFTSYLAGDQRNLLLNDLTPREREIFQGTNSNLNAAGNIGNELAQARMARDILTERQLLEVMTDFWFNHFNIYINKDSDQWYTTTYERDVIRKHALGKFGDLLMATATSPAMMVYLDNQLSIGPDSVANGVNPANPNSKKGNKGLNENYGREVMELHTVGVNGGYSQADVTSLAAILTGWTVDRPGQAGTFLFDPKRHEPGAKDWFGYRIAENGVATRIAAAPIVRSGSSAAARPIGSANVAVIPNVQGMNVDPGMKQGMEALAILAASPQTAHFISWKLAQRFVADDPPPALVDQMAKTYIATDGDIKAVLRTLIASTEFNSKKYFRNKVKTPVEFVASAFRSTATDPANPGALVNTVRAMGMPLYNALPPTGYYITADKWMNTGALVDRLNFASQLTTNKFYNQKFDSSRVLAMGLMSETGPVSVVQSSTAASPTTHPKLTSTLLAEGRKDSPAPGAGGPGVALRVLEDTIIGGPASAQTNQLIYKQINDQPAGTSPVDTLNLLTALVLGSPEFQLR